MYYSSKRQGFLIDQVSIFVLSFTSIPADMQGYAFKVITELHGIDEMENLVFKTQGQQISLLEEVLNTGNNDWETSDHYMRLNDGKHQHKTPRAQPDVPSGSSSVPGGVAAAQRFIAPLEHLSGGQNLSYQERNKNVKYVNFSYTRLGQG
jgi:DNA excision repair protein ERCC-3